MTAPPAAAPIRAWSRWFAAVVGLAVVIVAMWQIAAAADDVEITTVRVDGVPITVMAPPAPGPPGVVIAHGFAGSRQLMRSFGLVLANHGYAVALPDLAGHGGSPAGFDRDGAQLVADVLRARDLLVRAHGVPGDEVVLLGHSMGSGAVMRAGIEHPDLVAGVVAVSPTDADVTSELPADLKLMAGSLEQRFVANAQDLLDRAGGPRGAPGDDGRARHLEIVPGVEHVTILFSPSAHAAAARWIDAVVGRDHAPVGSVWLIGWWLAAVLGTVLTWRALAPRVVAAVPTGAETQTTVRSVPPRPRAQMNVRRSYLGMVLGMIGATATLASIAAGRPLGELAGMLVGPALAVWFAIAGTLWWWIGVRVAAPGRWELGSGGVLLAVLLLAFGALAPWVWLPFFPTLARAVYIVPFAVLVLPWAMAFVAGLRGRRGWWVVRWWAANSLLLLVGLWAAAMIVPGLGFLILLLPLLPPLLALVTVVVAPWVRSTEQVWGPASATAAFLGWTMAVLFPLA